MSISNIKNFYQSNNLNVQKQKEVEKESVNKEKQVKEEKQQEKTNVQNNKQEQVTISKEAMDKLNNQHKEEIRQDKVDELKKKIANGEFQVNASKVADKLLQQYQKTSLL